MTVVSELVEYTDGNEKFDCYIAYDDSLAGEKPGVLVCHAWAGRSDHEEDVAEKLAALGYVGIAVDLYGIGVRGNSVEENQALMSPFMENRGKLQSRLNAALESAKQHAKTDATNMAVCGYCFGGLCAIDMARSGADIKGAASFHGLLMAPGNTDGNRISAKVLAMHGWDDPMAKPEDVVAFGSEMTAAQADWQLHAYGGTMHAFTNKQANDPDFGTVYSATADNRSWQALENFLNELFG